MKLVAVLFFCTASIAAAVNNVAVFCSADDKIDQVYKACAFKVGVFLAQHQLGLVTGGSKTGLMNEVINGYRSVSAEGPVYGVLPLALKAYNVHHDKIESEKLIWTETIHERLSTFHELCDVCIVLPGGLGTLHELFDFLVHTQFGIHETCIILYNVEQFWDPLLDLINHLVVQKAVSEKHASRIQVIHQAADLATVFLSGKQSAGLTDLYWK